MDRRAQIIRQAGDREQAALVAETVIKEHAWRSHQNFFTASTTQGGSNACSRKNRLISS
jgi:hypothetical protein